MLVHCKVTPGIMVAGTHLYTWGKRDNVEESFLPKETARRPAATKLEPPTSRSEVQRANH